MSERKRIWLLIQGEIEIRDGQEVMTHDEVLGATYSMKVAEELQVVLVSASRRNNAIVRSTVTALPKALHELVSETEKPSLLDEILADIKPEGGK